MDNLEQELTFEQIANMSEHDMRMELCRQVEERQRAKEERDRQLKEQFDRFFELRLRNKQPMRGDQY